MEASKEELLKILNDIDNQINTTERYIRLIHENEIKEVRVRIELRSESTESETVESFLLPRHFKKWYMQYLQEMHSKFLKTHDKLTLRVSRFNRDITDPKTWIVGDIVRLKGEKEVLGVILGIKPENWPGGGIYVNTGNVIPDEYGVDRLELVQENH